MNFPRILLAALAATVAYLAFGSVVFGVLPLVRNEYAKYPAVYRKQEDMKRVMPIGMTAMFFSLVVLTVLYAGNSHSGTVLAEGARFGALIGLFALCAFVLHNHVNLNIGWKLTLLQAGAYFIEWTIVGIVIALVYKPL